MSLWERGRAAWPALDLPRAVFDAVPEPAFPEDLFLALACAERLSGALEAFEETFLARRSLSAALARVDPSDSFVDEVRQAVREKLFVQGRIREYSGKGPLAGWTRVVAMRVALDLRPVSMRPQPQNSGEHDPELAILKERYGKAFEEALANSFATLDDEQHNLLKLQIVDGLQTGQIAALFRVDRSTVKRRLAECRDVLLQNTQRLLREKLGLSPESFESLARLVQSQLHLSVARLLKERP
jgi:RNA polymerase sigma-70 factor (ECF subfamily)